MGSGASQAPKANSKVVRGLSTINKSEKSVRSRNRGSNASVKAEKSFVIMSSQSFVTPNKPAASETGDSGIGAPILENDNDADTPNVSDDVEAASKAVAPLTEEAMLVAEKQQVRETHSVDASGLLYRPVASKGFALLFE